MKQQRWHPFSEPDFLTSRQRTRVLLCPEIAGLTVAPHSRKHTRRQQGPLADPASLLQTGPAFDTPAAPPVDAPDEDEEGSGDNSSLAANRLDADHLDAQGGGNVGLALAPHEAENFASFAFDDVGHGEPPDLAGDDGAMHSTLE